MNSHNFLHVMKEKLKMLVQCKWVDDAIGFSTTLIHQSGNDTCASMKLESTGSGCVQWCASWSALTLLIIHANVALFLTKLPV